jgi:hypothetical protein
MNINSLGEIILDNDLAQIENLNPEQKSICETCYAIQDAITDGRFRACYYDNTIWLSTEFIYFMDCPEDRAAIDAAALEIGAQVIELFECPHNDARIINYGTPKEKYIQGPNHGRLECQVSLDIAVSNVEQATELRNKISSTTEHLWERLGVTVI